MFHAIYIYIHSKLRLYYVIDFFILICKYSYFFQSIAGISTYVAVVEEIQFTFSFMKIRKFSNHFKHAVLNWLWNKNPIEKKSWFNTTIFHIEDTLKPTKSNTIYENLNNLELISDNVAFVFFSKNILKYC